MQLTRLRKDCLQTEDGGMAPGPGSPQVPGREAEHRQTWEQSRVRGGAAYGPGPRQSQAPRRAREFSRHAECRLWRHVQRA